MGRPFEVTTLRRDVETDGRHAVVAFGTSLEEDAARRDFTLNALYLDADGAVLDPVGGLPDLRAARVRFVGDARARVREDHLRSLRFFRFHATHGDPAGGIDADALDAVARNLDGLDALSRERVTGEVLRLLAAPDPAPALAAMRATGALHRVLPGAAAEAVAPLVHVEAALGLPPDPIRRLAALSNGEGLRLPSRDARRLGLLRDLPDLDPAALGYRLKDLAPDASPCAPRPSGRSPTPPTSRRPATEPRSVPPPRRRPPRHGPGPGRGAARAGGALGRLGFTLTRDDLLG
jgi:tRNA nucleotidyltransferase/poly(A) polymerase